jgi:predicted HTH domain antitoxin
MHLDISLPDMSTLSEFDLRMSLAAKLYEDGKLSLGYCADVAGLSKRSFSELLGKYKVSLFQQTQEEIIADTENANKLFQQNHNI